MHCIELFAEAVRRCAPEHVPELPEEPQGGTCAIIGKEKPTIKASRVLGKSFTQWSELACPESDRVSVDAWIAWGYGWRREGKKVDFHPERHSSWLVTQDSIVLLDRKAVRDAVLAGSHGPLWAGYATTSYKKHGSLLAPVNYGGRAVWLWETERVDCSDMNAVQEIWQELRKYQDMGIPRPVLESVDIDATLAAKVGIKAAIAFRKWAMPLRESALYRFLCYLLPSKAELAEEDSTNEQRTPAQMEIAFDD